MKLKLWLVTRVAACNPNQNVALVLRAESAEQARYFASQVAREEGREVWHNSKRSECVELTTHGEPGVIVIHGF
jgi:hypothetical protein